MTRVAVLFFGAIGLALVARAASFYRDSDPLAHALVILIGLGLVLGLVELLQRATRAVRLTTELAGLPRPATAEAVEKASAGLRPLLESRMAGMPGQAATALFTSYLLGLLVMIGLLGTFMGLLDTLQGAREALTSSGDINALRAGLGSPMQGLSRAFGTSAAGVSASAMLGLASVFVRRSEAQLANALLRYAAGPLAALTVGGRTLAALEALARQGEALPVAAEALRKVSARLTQLEKGLLEAHAESRKESAAAIKTTAAEVRADLKVGIDDAAAATALAIERLAQLEKGLLEAHAQSRKESAAAIKTTATEVRADLKVGIDDAAAATALAIERLAQLEKGLLEAHAQSRKENAAAIKATAAEVRADLKAGIDDAAEATALAIEPLMARVVDRAGAVANDHAERLRGRLDADADARRAEDGARGEQLKRLGEAMAGSMVEVARSAQAGPEAASRLVDAAGERLARRAQADAARDARLDALLDRLAHTSEAITEASRLQGAGLASFVDASAERAAEREARTEARLLSMIEHAEGILEQQAARFMELESKLDLARGASAEALGEQLVAHARGLGESLDATAAMVAQAADLVRAGGAEMSAVAEMFGGAVDRYREANDRWLASFPALEEAVNRGSNGEGGDLLGAYLDQTREVFDHSLQFQRELFSELRALRAPGLGAESVRGNEPGTQRRRE